MKKKKCTWLFSFIAKLLLMSNLFYKFSKSNYKLFLQIFKINIKKKNCDGLIYIMFF